MITRECYNVLETIKYLSRFKYAVFEIIGSDTITSEEIKLDDSELNGTSLDSLSDLEIWNMFVNTLSDKKCRYVIYSFSSSKDGSINKKLAFISWIPTNAPPIEKRRYSDSAYEDFKRYVTPIFSYKASDIDELSYENISSLLF